MSFNNGPTIVTNGLVLALDAGDRNSYVSGSSTWSSLIDTSISCSLINGPTFNSSSISFDGTNDYGSITYGFSGYEGTFDFWFKTSNTSSYLFISNKGSLTASPSVSNGLAIFMPDYNTGFLYVYVNNSTGISKTALSIASSVPDIRNNSWINSCATVSYTGTNTILSLYINGNLTVSQTRAGDYFDFFNLTPDNILAALSPTVARSAIDLATIKMYNRALSATEVLQNYNATKGRFGL